jgi:hypothetical protein
MGLTVSNMEQVLIRVLRDADYMIRPVDMNVQSTIGLPKSTEQPHLYSISINPLSHLSRHPDQILPQIPLQQYDVGTAITTTTTLDRTLQTDTSNGNFVYEPILHMGDTRVLDSLYGMDDKAVDPKIDFIQNAILLAAAQK